MAHNIECPTSCLHKNVETVQSIETIKYNKKIIKISQLRYKRRTFIDQIIDKIEQIFHQTSRQKRNHILTLKLKSMRVNRKPFSIKTIKKQKLYAKIIEKFPFII